LYKRKKPRPVLWYRENPFFPRGEDSRPPPSRGNIKAAGVQSGGVVVKTPDPGEKAGAAAHQDRAADAQKTAGSCLK
ncbi:hypothetical protein Q2378_26665, partial [Escherichia coli]|nr:hypothetical protein [Escherichia coli]